MLTLPSGHIDPSLLLTLHLALALDLTLITTPSMSLSLLLPLDRHSNFRDFGSSMLLLARMVTGEGWNFVMQVGYSRAWGVLAAALYG